MHGCTEVKLTRADLVDEVVKEARAFHAVRASLPPLIDRGSIEFMDWQDAFLDRSVRVSVAVERLDKFEAANHVAKQRT